MIEHAINLARTIEDPETQARLLAMCVTRLPYGDMKEELAEEVFDAISCIQNDVQRASTLHDVLLSFAMIGLL